MWKYSTKKGGEELEWYNIIITVGAVIGALITIKKVVIPIINFVKRIINTLEKIDKMEEHSQENYLGIKRLTVMSSDMPLGERICAARDYIKHGGNGDVKKFAKEHLHVDDVIEEE